MKKLLIVTAVLLSAFILVGTASAVGNGWSGYHKNRIFVGTGMQWCMDKFGSTWGTEEACREYLGSYADDKITMKWNAEWDRGNTENWANGPYNAWTDNEWNGKFPGGSGAVWHYKIVWVGPELQNSLYWRDGGYPIWDEFEVLMDQGIDPNIGPGHIWFAHGIPNGYGN